MSILDVLRFCNDTDTTELRMFGVFGWIRLGFYEYGKIQLRYTKMHCGGRTGLVVRASDSGSGDPGSILGRVGVLFP